jgi:hypothetical protein
MQTITTIGLDIAKSVFQIHGVDAGGQAVIRRQLKRLAESPSPCPQSFDSTWCQAIRVDSMA